MLAALAAALATALLAAGCGGDDATTASTATDPAPSTTTTEREGDGRVPTGDGRGGVELREIGSFNLPVYVTQPPASSGDEHLYVVEQGGTIQRVAKDGSDVSTFLDISSEVVSGGEQGLLSVAFAPDYADSGLLYVNFTDTDGNTRIVEYEASDDQADPGSARELLRIEQPFPNHNGGLVAFGPDERLYIGMGDGGSGGDPDRNGLDLTTLLGKLLRIDPEPSDGQPYSIPADNPYAEDGEARPEIYSSGLRNPWRFSFDQGSGLLTIGDVGQDSEEELDAVGLEEAAGSNFGWSAFEGNTPFNEDQPVEGEAAAAGRTIEPALIRTHEEGYCSITGGLIVRDENLPSLYGRYIYGDLCQTELRSFVPRDGQPAEGDRGLGVDVSRLVSFGTDTDDRVYAVSIEGPVYRLAPE